MPKPFKLRYVSEVAGFFVLVCVGVLIAGIYFAGHKQGWFEPKLILHAVFSTNEGAFGLQKGAEIKILNAVAGTVTDVHPNESGEIEATFSIQGAYQRYVTVDSKALVKKKFEVAGDAYVVIEPGNRDQPVMQNGDRIVCEKDTEIVQILLDTLDELSTASLPAIKQLRMSLEELPGLTIQVEETLHETEKLLEGLQRHWLLRRYVDQSELSELISPSEVGAMKGDAK